MTSEVSQISIQKLRELVVRHTGLNFPAGRETDLWRGVAGAAAEAGFDSVDSYAEHLLTTNLSERQVGLLASHLTVGETYFFRDPHAFVALEETILPELIAAARERGRLRLRLWSAACCTGEEAFSLAIAVQRALPDAANWELEILGSDISPRFLEKAERGIFGEWAFRDTPPEFRERYFRSAGGQRWELRPDIRRMVRFLPLNLADAAYPIALHGALGFDLIFCRNALIYFTAEDAAQVVRKLAACLHSAGWLVLGPNELCYGTSPGLSPVRFPGAILHRKGAGRRTHEFHDTAVPGRGPSVPAQPSPERTATHDGNLGLRRETPRRRATATPPSASAAVPSAREQAGAAPLLDTARTLANRGRLRDALAECDRLVRLHKLEPAVHYLRATVFEELGDWESAAAALRNALFAAPDFVLAHVHLGSLLRRKGREREAARHFDHALALVRRRPAEELVPEADGLTAAQIAQMIETLRSAGDGARTPLKGD